LFVHVVIDFIVFIQLLVTKLKTYFSSCI